MPSSARDLTAQKVQFQKEQAQLFQDLLGVLDSLDHACTHWQQAEQEHLKTLNAKDVQPQFRSKGGLCALHRWWQRFLSSFGNRRSSPQQQMESEIVCLKASMTDILSSGREGVELIRRSLLEILEQRDIVVIEAMGQPFDPNCMYALGRQESTTVPENRVVQEVVKGYLWRDRILREAQVIVASQPSSLE